MENLDVIRNAIESISSKYLDGVKILYDTSRKIGLKKEEEKLGKILGIDYKILEKSRVKLE